MKNFDGQIVLKGVNLDIYEKEFVTLLGPSGCGKTTLLRILGGFLDADEGQVIFDGEEISKKPPYERELNTVFQKYALFPHLSVYENIAFGLKIKKMSKDIIDQKVMKMLRLIGLEGFENKNTTLLSGGQQENSKKPETASEVAARAAVMTLPDLPDEDTDREMYHLTKEMMAAQGYERYEISNYAKKGYECRHNTGYWTGVEYLGLGLGASSYTYGYRYHNTEDLQEYLSLNLYEGGAAARDIEELSLEDKMEEFMFVGLRMMKGVSGSEFLERFGLNMWNVYGDVLKKLEQQGLIEVEAPMVRLTERGSDVSYVGLSEFLIDRE